MPDVATFLLVLVLDVLLQLFLIKPLAFQHRTTPGCNLPMTQQRCCCAPNNVIQEKTIDTEVSKSPAGRRRRAEPCNALSTSPSFKRSCCCTPAICMLTVCQHMGTFTNTGLMFGSVYMKAEAVCTVNNTPLKQSSFFFCASFLNNGGQSPTQATCGPFRCSAT